MKPLSLWIFADRRWTLRLMGLVLAAGCLAWNTPAIWSQGVRQESAVRTVNLDLPQLRVMSFNLRYANAADGVNAWEHRRHSVVELLKKTQPDLLGTQETLLTQREFLDQALPEYHSIGVGRDDGRNGGEMTAIWFRKSRFEELESGHFWLSERPDLPGSVAWDSSLTRMVTWVRLRDLAHPERREFVWLNTHFDHRGVNARVQSAKLIVQRAAQLAGTAPQILTGDFNTSPADEPYRILMRGSQTIPLPSGENSGPFIDTWRVIQGDSQTAEGTFSGFDSTRARGPRIDWIGVSPTWQVLGADIIRPEPGERCPSDHFPVTAILQWPDDD